MKKIAMSLIGESFITFPRLLIKIESIIAEKGHKIEIFLNFFVIK